MLGDYLSTDDVSAITGIPKGTLRYYRATNQGPESFTLGGSIGRRGRVVYRREAVDQWIAAQEQATRRGGGDAA